MPAISSLSRVTGAGMARRTIGPPPAAPNYNEQERQRAGDLAANARDFGLSGHVTDPNTGAYYSTGGSGGRGAASSSQPEDDFYGDLSRMMTMFPGSSTATPPPQVPQVGPIDTSAAQAAAFARAKDQVGQTAGGAIRSLRSVAGARGQLGSGAEARQTAGVINTGQGQLGEVSREQAIDSAKLAEDMAKFNYTGKVAQRRDDMDASARARETALAENNARFSQMSALLALKRRKAAPVSY